MSDETPRVVFDCNVFVQAAANRNSPARQALRLFFDGRISLFVSEAVLRELGDVLNRPAIRQKLSGLTDRLVNALLQKVGSRAILIRNVPEEFHYERDPKDEAYVNLAIVTNATFLVSKDNDLLDLMTSASEQALRFRVRYPFMRIMNAVDFVREMRRQGIGI